MCPILLYNIVKLIINKNKRDKMSELFKKTKVTKKIYNLELIKERVDEHLSSNKIEDRTYVCTGLKETSHMCSEYIDIYLKEVGEDLYNNGYIDEDFNSDENWDKFCDKLSEELGCRIGVPYYYYPK